MTVSKLEFILLCNSFAQVKYILEKLSIDVDEKKFMTEYLVNYRKYRAILQEHSGPEGTTISMSESAEGGR